MESSQKTALLLLDFQPNIVKFIPDKTPVMNSLNIAIDAAHKSNILVIFVVMALREGFPELNSNNKWCADYKAQPIPNFTEELVPDSSLHFQQGDLIVKKKRASAFTGSDLEVILRAHKIERLVIAGIATSAVVLSTVREAADKDYALTILSDCCVDFDEEVQRVLLQKIFPTQADVVTAKEWADSISKKSA
jgi:Amidases related to nicotinamidase